MSLRIILDLCPGNNPIYIFKEGETPNGKTGEIP